MARKLPKRANPTDPLATSYLWLRVRPEAKRALKMLAAQEDIIQEVLLREAVYAYLKLDLPASPAGCEAEVVAP